jgi:hypothetical protein
MFSTRIPKDWEEELNQILKDMGISKKEFIGIALKKIRASYNRVYQKGLNFGEILGYSKGHNDGINEASETWAIWYFCDICNKEILVEPNTNSHKAIIQYMKEYGWGHSECHKENLSYTY